MNDCTFPTFAGAAACLLLFVAGRASATPDTAIEPAPTVAAKQVKGTESVVPKPAKATRHAAAARPTVAAKPVAAPAPAHSGASGPLSAEQSAALARQRLNRCHLHPGTCVQGPGGPPPPNSPSGGKDVTERPDISDGRRD
jgi:hypothetical protein